ncbi:MAG: hypothetical protein J6D37_07650 [Clostridia bacterium]|nr:hypothetical protein [Clostridia bacterium]
MKKKIVLSALALSLAGVALVGCGTPSLSLTANWYRDTSISTAISGTSEQLVYSVSYQEGAGNEHYAVSYEIGTYTVSLINTFYEWKDGSGAKEEVYRLTSRLDISGKYTMNGTEVPFTDFVDSVCYLRTIPGGLAPVYSEKKVHSTSPSSLSPSSPENMCTVFDYETSVSYARDGSVATVKKTDLTTSKTEETEVKLPARLFDNEELLFLGRAINFTSSLRVSCLNANSAKVEPVLFSAVSAQESDFTFNGTKHEKVSCTTVGLSLDSEFSGASQVLTYANRVEGANTYRNVLLSMEVPLSYRLGSLVYTLESATFTDK